MKTRRAERALFVAVVLALHALLLWAWPKPDRSPRAATQEAVVLTRPIMVLPPPTAHPPSVSPAVPPRAEARAHAPPPARAVSRRRSEAMTRPSAEPAAPAPASDAAPPAVAAAASQPLDLRLRVPPAMARRGGLTGPADSMRAQALNDPRSNHLSDPRQALPDAVAASAKGDCLKGEYAGWGMGLLSVPFLAYHAAVGNCKPMR